MAPAQGWHAKSRSKHFFLPYRSRISKKIPTQLQRFDWFELLSFAILLHSMEKFFLPLFSINPQAKWASFRCLQSNPLPLWLISTNNSKMEASITTNNNNSPTTIPNTPPSIPRIKEGWLVKIGDKWKTWKKRWFELSIDRLDYYVMKVTVVIHERA